VFGRWRAAEKSTPISMSHFEHRRARSAAAGRNKGGSFHSRPRYRRLEAGGLRRRLSRPAETGEMAEAAR